MRSLKSELVKLTDSIEFQVRETHAPSSSSRRRCRCALPASSQLRARGAWYGIMVVWYGSTYLFLKANPKCGASTALHTVRCLSRGMVVKHLYL
jgi:hypothetical protein